LQRLDQLVALREPLKKPPNRRRSRHRKIINPVDAKIKLTRRERGPDQLRCDVSKRVYPLVPVVPRHFVGRHGAKGGVSILNRT
jgi:hypothetical protein